MARTVFLAGAAGAIGRRLVPLLLEAGYEVFGVTRSEARAEGLKALGVEPAIVDVFDAAALCRAVAAAHPEIVIHQLTDLPPGLDPARMDDAIVRNARIRIDGTRNLVDAANAAGARRLIAQSMAWGYAPGPEPHGEPHGEGDLLDLAAEGARATSVRGVAALEQAVLSTPPIEGVVLRYGQLYGPGTGADTPAGNAPLHIDAAAQAALLAIDRARPGIYNVAEANAYADTGKARRELGWDPAFRLNRKINLQSGGIT
ncbi:MAG: NAD-dependent epimerase/dehydratase family protein [Alphaproteobacteria bacterium]|nr:NAD-dependent epimerase/dehydratase family protein [Alphaproteobacteria bacterium]